MDKKHIACRHHFPAFKILICLADASILVLLLAGMILSMTPTTALAQGPEITIDPPSGMPGSTVTVTGSNFMTKLSVAITMDNSVLAGDVIVAGYGTFSVSVVIPDLPPGNKTVTATDGQMSASTSFSVLAPPTTIAPPVAPSVVSRTDLAIADKSWFS